jgi:2-methylcitrate dehydratase PrpD
MTTADLSPAGVGAVPADDPATTCLGELAAWASSLRLDDVPARVRQLATSQVLSQLAAVRAGRAHPLGAAVERGFGRAFQPDVKQSAYVLSALGAWLHFDDTAYAGHLGNSTVTVPAAYAHARGLSGRDLLLAVVAANECAARVTAAATLGVQRGQSATHTHLVGAVAGRLACEPAPAAQWTDALGLCFGMPPVTVARGFLGSDAKVFSAALPVRIGLDACDAAAAGLHGAADVLEHREGFLARFVTVPVPAAVTTGLGTRWHTDTLSFKLHPGGPGMDAAVDCAGRLHGRLAAAGAVVADIAEIVVDTSIYTVVVNQRAAGYLARDRAAVSALVFSVPYTVARSLVTGGLEPADFTAPAVHDPGTWALAERVRVRHDAAMSRELFHCEVPFGEALREAGPRAAEWLATFGVGWSDEAGEALVELVGDLPEPSGSFEDARKVTPARLTVRLADGRELVEELTVPLGAVGSPSRDRHPELVREKFLSTGGPAAAADALADLENLTPSELRAALSAAVTEEN